MSSIIIGWIRTLVPLAVGALISWGVLPDDLSDQAAAVGYAVITSLYYLVARFLAKKWPVFEWLLGVGKSPSYGA